jgi:hypothetical protein
MIDILWIIFACTHLFVGIKMIDILCSKLNIARGDIVLTTTILCMNITFFTRAIWNLV